MLAVTVLTTLLTTVYAPKRNFTQIDPELEPIDTSKEIQEIRASLIRDNYDYVQEPVPRHGDGLQTSSVAPGRFSVVRNAGDRRPEQDVSYKLRSPHSDKNMSQHSQFVYREVKPVKKRKKEKETPIEKQMTKTQLQKKKLVTKRMFDRQPVQRRVGEVLQNETRKNVTKMEGVKEYQNISQK